MTPTVLTPEQMAELREAAEKATPGPWQVYPSNYADEPGYRHGIDAPGETVVVQHYSEHDDERGVFGRTPEEGRANARFIAKANPATIIALLDGYDALKEHASKLDADCADAIEHAKAWQARGEKAEAERERMRVAVALADRAIDASYAQANAEYHHQDRTAEKHDKVVREAREAIRATLTKEPPRPNE